MKKKIKLIAILLVVVVAGGFGVMQFMGGEQESHEPELAFVPLDPLFAPVVREHQFKGYVLLTLQLELSDSRDLETVNASIAPLRDAFIHDLHLQAMLRRKDEPSINIFRVKKRFLLIVERVIGPGIVSDVLVDSAMERRS